MKIGILGTRGIPNAYGGFEQFAEYLSLGLVEKGHSVYVYNSSNHPYQQNTWNNIHLIHCKDWEDKIGTAGQFIYDYNCLKDARNRNFDILLQLGYTSNSIWHRMWPKHTINIVNMDGLEWKRSKYKPTVQRFLEKAEGWATTYADLLVSDSIGIQEHILLKYKKKSTYIPYGANIPAGFDIEALSKWGLNRDSYALLIARMEPENNIQMIIEGYLASNYTFPLIVVGNFSNKYGQSLFERFHGKQLMFVGAIYDQHALNSLRFYSGVYFHGHSVGGTNPSLLEAMACQCNIAAHENTFNKAVLQGNAFYFHDARGVSEIFIQPFDSATIEERKKANLETIRTKFNWPGIIDQYESLFLHAAGSKIDQA